MKTSHQALAHRGRATAAGFTLIELMIVVAVVALLAGVALPSYTRHVTKANRSAAQQFMLNMASREEQYMLDARSYTSTIGSTGLNLTAPTELASRYTFAVVAAAGPPPTYTITATAIGPQASDGDLTLDNLGVKAPIDKWTK